MDWVVFWTEIKPILGPLIQALVVLLVGAFTVFFQLRQAKTAERKLLTDLHDKRYEALSSFTRDVTEMVLDILYDDDTITPPTDLMEQQQKSRQMFARMQQLEWLYGDDVMAHVARMYDRAEMIQSFTNRLRHHLKDDDDVDIINAINEHNDDLYNALDCVNIAAHRYLYVGNIRFNKVEAAGPRVFRVPKLSSLEKLKQQDDALK